MRKKSEKKATRAVIHFSVILMSFVLLLASVQVHATSTVSAIIQNSSALQSSDGTIIDQTPLHIQSAFSDQVDCFRITYLSDELKVVGFLLAPKTRDKKLPVLIYNRGGNRDYGMITENLLVYLAFLASNSYVVLASQYRGNDGGEGREEFGGNDVNDVLNLIPLANSLEFTDMEKIVMLGVSRGGMMTYLAIKKEAPLKAAAVVGGVSDITQLYRERNIGMKQVIEELVGTNEEEWNTRSAYYFAEQISVPVLILHGEDDDRVNVTQATKLAERLSELGKEHEIVVFPNGDHGLQTHWQERNKMILEFFAKHLALLISH